MAVNDHLTSTAYVAELSRRIKNYRIDYPITQKELADKTGISPRSISRFESGEDIQLSNLIKILMALDLGDNINLLVPDTEKRPSYFLTEEKNKRKRATSAKKRRTENRTFQWGDEK